MNSFRLSANRRNPGVVSREFQIPFKRACSDQVIFDSLYLCMSNTFNNLDSQGIELYHLTKGLQNFIVVGNMMTQKLFLDTVSTLAIPTISPFALVPQLAAIFESFFVRTDSNSALSLLNPLDKAQNITQKLLDIHQ